MRTMHACNTRAARYRRCTYTAYTCTHTGTAFEHSIDRSIARTCVRVHVHAMQHDTHMRIMYTHTHIYVLDMCAHYVYLIFNYMFDLLAAALNCS